MDRELTLGVEEEFQIIDPVTRELRSYVSEMIGASGDLSPVALKQELHQSAVEVGTDICNDIRECRDQVVGNRREAARVAARLGMRIGAASTHPFSHWLDQPISEGPRYRKILEDFQEIARGNLIFGLHVHVGIPDREEAIAVFNSARYFLPHLLAMSTSSPFFEGRKTGLKSVRTLIFKRLPRTDMPNRFDSYQEFLSFVALLQKTGCIDDGRRIWWDLRPHPEFSTLEFRICDIPSRVDDVVAIAALVQALVAFLLRLHRGNRAWRVYRTALIQENKWRALRYGLDAHLIDFGKQVEIPVCDLLRELIDLLHRDAEALGSAHELAHVERMLKDGTSADRQLRVWEETKDLHAVVDHVLTETLLGVSDETPSSGPGGADSDVEAP